MPASPVYRRGIDSFKPGLLAAGTAVDSATTGVKLTFTCPEGKRVRSLLLIVQAGAIGGAQWRASATPSGGTKIFFQAQATVASGVTTTFINAPFAVALGPGDKVEIEVTTLFAASTAEIALWGEEGLA